MTTPTTVQVRFQFRADTAANWTSIDPILLANELGRETDTGKIKIGDGTTAWSSLGYQALGRISDADIATDAEIAVSKLANGTANQILTTDGTDVTWTDSPTIAGNVIITGNLTVNGTETIINVDTLQVEDKTIEMGNVTTPTDVTADGGGIVLKGATDKTILWVNSTDSWTSSENVDLASGKTYKIAGTDVLSATTLGSGVTGSSLTSVGTITSGVWSGTALTADAIGADAINGSKIADDSIDSEHYVDGSIDTVHLADDAVDASKLANTTVTAGSYTAADITVDAQGRITSAANGTISTAEIADDAVTSAKIADGTIVDGDISAAAAIADTKLNTISTAGKVSNSATTATAANTSSAIVARDADGNFSAGTITADLDGNASTVTTNANLTGDVTSVGNATSIAAGVIVDGDVSASAAIAGTKISPDFGSQTVQTSGVFSAAGGAEATPSIAFTGDLNTGIYSPGADQVAISTGGTGRLFIDSSGRLLVGTSSSFTMGRIGAVQVAGGTGASANNAFISATRFGTTSGGGELILGASYGSNGTHGLVPADHQTGVIRFAGSDGTNGLYTAQIASAVDGTPGTNDMPGRLVFSTTADGASSPTEQMRITSVGEVSNKTASIVSVSEKGWTLGAQSAGGGYFMIKRNSGAPVFINRGTNDGVLIAFYGQNTQEGDINVSGTTVSLNGAHLSRWSQLPSGATREEILRGTVLSNIDEMCEWSYEAEPEVLWAEGDELPEGVNVGDVKTAAKEAGTEDNEQLNRMKVSDVEGDRNVSGVFQDWDDDDDTYTNDFYCAMTGDFVIRIAQGVTVERGDLLMSAGDGTAKPQDDDIIRSKTIAKVTSTHVSATYADGSYCVPCVLMAC